MSHWAERYTSRVYAYKEGEFDCADFVRLVMSEVFRREIRLPGREYLGQRGEAKHDAMAAQIRHDKSDYALATHKPREGDGVLMICRGKPSHIGIYCVINGEAWVLHNAANARQSVLHRIRELDRQGMSVEGYYRWI
jgi:hypothetical protein